MAEILVIDDDLYVRQNIVQILEFEGFTVIDAETGMIGVEIATARLPDLIICDITMADLDGYGVLTQLRTNATTATIPFIFVTARADRNDTRYGMTLGADDYLTKPFTVAELLEAVNTQIEKRAVVNHLSEQKLDSLRASITLALPHELRTPLSGILG